MNILLEDETGTLPARKVKLLLIMESCIVIFLLLAVQVVIFLLVQDETTELSFLITINDQEAQTTRTRQHTLEYIQSPNGGSAHIVQDDMAQWDQSQTFLLQNAARFGSGVSSTIYKTPTLAQGFRFYTNKILYTDGPTDYDVDYASQTLYVGQYNTTLIEAEDMAINQSITISWIGFSARATITGVVIVVVLIELAYFLFYLYKPLLTTIQTPPQPRVTQPLVEERSRHE